MTLTSEVQAIKNSIIEELLMISENLDNTKIVITTHKNFLEVELKTKKSNRKVSEAKIDVLKEKDASNIFIDLLHKMKPEDTYLEKFNRKLINCEQCRKKRRMNYE